VRPRMGYSTTHRYVRRSEYFARCQGRAKYLMGREIEYSVPYQAGPLSGACWA
jgi:hypothetical protein